MAAINFDAIAQELTKGLGQAEQFAANLGLNKASALRELYTLGVSASRQSGKTTWLIENLIRHPDARLVVINTAQQEDIIRRLMGYQYIDRHGFMVSPTHGTLMVPDDVAAIIREDKHVLHGATCRVLTSYRLKAMIDEDIDFPTPVSHIYVDGQLQVFDRIRSTKYYTWLAKRSSKPIVTWLID